MLVRYILSLKMICSLANKLDSGFLFLICLAILFAVEIQFEFLFKGLGVVIYEISVA